MYTYILTTKLTTSDLVKPRHLQYTNIILSTLDNNPGSILVIS